MARIVFAWEWGAGASHLGSFAPIAQSLLGEGHEITVVSRELNHAPELFPDQRIRCLQCPTFTSAPNSIVSNPTNLAHLAWNLGFCDSAHVQVLLRFWRDILSLIRPDVLISDFGIGGVAVANATGVPVIRIGNGFLCPPCLESPPLFDCVMNGCTRSVAAKEASAFSDNVLSAINRNLSIVGLPGKQGWPDLLVPGERSVLTTIPPLDPYRRQRESADYVGYWSHAPTGLPQWPSFGEPKAFAYLKPFRELPRLLTELTAAEVGTALVSDNIPRQLIPDTLSQFVREQIGMVDLKQLEGNCAFAVCNGNHGLSTLLLMHGIPVLCIPLYLEQKLNASAIANVGCGITVSSTAPDDFGNAIHRIIEDASLSSAAQNFSAEYHSYTIGALERANNRIRKLMP